MQKDASKSRVPSGGLHPLTRYTMNYLIFLADYGGALTDIYSDQPFQLPASMLELLFGTAAMTSVPPSFAYRGVENSSSISLRFAWLILVPLCKLDSKAEAFREVLMAYLFLANNLHYVVNKVRGSQLKDLLDMSGRCCWCREWVHLRIGCEHDSGDGVSTTRVEVARSWSTQAS